MRLQCNECISVLKWSESSKGFYYCVMCVCVCEREREGGGVGRK